MAATCSRMHTVRRSAEVRTVGVPQVRFHMAKTHLKLVAPTEVNRTVAPTCRPRSADTGRSAEATRQANRPFGCIAFRPSGPTLNRWNRWEPECQRRCSTSTSLGGIVQATINIRSSSRCRPTLQSMLQRSLSASLSVVLALRRSLRANQFPIARAARSGAPFPAVSFLGGFRTPALVRVERSSVAGIRNPSHKPRRSWRVQFWRLRISFATTDRLGVVPMPAM